MDKTEATTLIILKLIEQDKYSLSHFGEETEAHVNLICDAYKKIYTAVRTTENTPI